MSNVKDIQKEIDLILSIAAERINPQTVYLFGSWARGDARSNSDIDLAFLGSDLENWSEFVNEIQYDAPVLRKCDLVKMETAQQDLLEHILNRGRIIYERKN